MKQLGGLDATFLYMETPQTPMHVAALTLFELPEGFQGTFLDHFRAFFASRIHLVPIFEKKLARTVFDLDHPGWVDADDVDLEDHIRGITLDKPGLFSQLEAVVGELHSVPLDRRKPLWQFHVIDGLEDGRVALYAKVHHAAVDGGAGMVILQAVMDFFPEPRPVPPRKPGPPKRKKPSVEERALLGIHDVISNVARQQISALQAIPGLIANVTDTVLAATKTAVETGKLPKVGDLLAPKTRFNASVSDKRLWAARSLPLADAKMIAKATGAKINDVVMALCGGALRLYLEEHNELPAKPLIAFVPISLRELGNTDINNQVFGMNVPIATDVADPIKRIKRVRAASTQNKMLAGSLKDAAPKDFTLLGAPHLLPGLMQLYGSAGLAGTMPMAVNLTISNTMGPQFPIYCAGAKVLALYPVSIATHGVALNITVQSYMGSLDFGITADAKAVPDVARLADLFEDALHELKDAVAALPAKSSQEAPAASEGKTS